MYKQLKSTHVWLILALPIVLALINPNWLFNAGIVDDYLYLGYQLNLPKYFQWEPSVLTYFLERMSWLLPTYMVRQAFSPLAANFIIHLSVYYLAIFSVYGTLKRLFNGKVAIIIALLFGQYPLIMRAAGWDYLDGYSMALFAFIIFCLTQAVGSKYTRRYLIVAGCAFALMVNANFFSAFYTPALGLYYLFLSDWREKFWSRLLSTIFYTALGAILVTAGLAGVYYLLTTRLLYENTFKYAASTVSSQFSYYFSTKYAPLIHPHWVFMYAAVSSLIIFRPMVWRYAHRIPSENPNIRHYRVILRAMLALFSISLLILGYYQFQDYVFAWMHIYNTNWILVSFLFLGVILAPRLSDEKQRAHQYGAYIAFFIPMLPLAIFSIYPDIFTIFNHYVLYIGAIICLIMAFFPRMVIFGVVGFALFAGAMLNDSRTYNGYHYPLRIDVYVADRYMLQDIYEKNIEMARLINDRYENFDEFRLFYTGRDPNRRVFAGIDSMLMWSWEWLLPYNELIEKIESARRPFQEIIVLTTADRAESILDDLRKKIQFNVLETHIIPYSRGDINIIFIEFLAINPSP